MSLLGKSLTLLIGPTIAVPAPQPITEALSSVEITHNESGPSTGTLTFRVGRSSTMEIDYALLANPLLRPFNRVVLMVTFNVIPQVLFDGFITQVQLSPGNDPGATTLVLTVDDVSVMMDLEDKRVTHIAQDETTIANLILLGYMTYLAFPPVVLPPTAIDFPPPTVRIPAQAGTDRAYLNEMAGRYNYVFYVTPGPLPNQNRAYWGPQERGIIPQRALSVNMASESNVDQINFSYNALAPTVVIDDVQPSDIPSPQPLPVILPVSTLLPPLAPLQSPMANLPHVRRSRLSGGAGQIPSRGGVSYAQAWAQAAAIVNNAAQEALQATGTLDALRYGDLLQPRGIVGLRGAGLSHDGLYYVKSVSHSIRIGEYKQRFTLTREGLGPITPLVRP
jgi:hypothetical protein